MKLPDNKPEKLKVLVLSGMGAMGVIYALLQLLVLPLLRSEHDAVGSTEQLRDDLRAAKVEIQRMPEDERRNRGALREILDINERYILEPRLGNFQLGATEILERHAAMCGLQIDDTREFGISELPRDPAQTAKYALRAYSIGVTLQCSYGDIFRLLQSIETANPYICVPVLAIQAQPLTPEIHLATFTVQWPVWADQAAAEALVEKARESVAQE